MGFCRHWKLTVLVLVRQIRTGFYFYTGCEAGLTEEPKSNERSGNVPERLLGYFCFLGEDHEQYTNRSGCF